MRGIITGRATKPMEQEYEISIKLTLSDWVTLVEQMRTMKGSSSYPAFHLIDGIDNVVKHAKEFFMESITKE